MEAGAATSSLWPEALTGVPAGAPLHSPAAPAAPTAGPSTGGLVAGETPAANDPGERLPDEAIRWRLNAAIADNAIHFVLFLLFVGILVAQGIVLNMWVLVALAFLTSWLYHCAFESRGGQTPGKKRFGVKVVRVDGGSAEPWRIAVRNLLRGVDEYGPLCASGLMTMWLSGAARRQRLGDKAAGTMVVPVSGRDRRRPSPRWLLPVLASLALLIGVAEINGAVHASSPTRQSSTFKTNFVAGCNANAPSNESCSCLYRYLHDRAGYRTDEQWAVLLRQVEAAMAAHDPSQLPPAYVAAALACRTG